MTPAQARLVLRDNGLKSLIECTKDAQVYIPEAAAHLKKLEWALKSLRRLTVKISKRKTRRK